MSYKTYDEFLQCEKFHKQNPMVLDDEWPDAYSDWVADQDPVDLIAWADEWAKMDETIVKDLKQLSDDLFNACSDNPDLQLTWNSALRQAAYKVDALKRKYERVKLSTQEERG